MHHEHDHISGGHRCFGLAGDGAVDALGVRVPATGVLHPESPASPLAEVGDAVAGHAREVLHHGLAAADEAVDQRGLAHVRPAHDRHGAQGLALGLISPEHAEGFLHGVPVGAAVVCAEQVEVLGVGEVFYVEVLGAVEVVILFVVAIAVVIGGVAELVGGIAIVDATPRLPVNHRPIGGAEDERLQVLGGVLPCGASSLGAVQHQACQRLHDLIDGEVTSVDDRRVLRRPQWRGCPRGVSGIPALNVGEDGVEINITTSGNILIEAALSPDLRRRRHERLDRRIRQHHGADVPALHHAAAGRVGQVALQRHEVLTHFGNRRDGRDMRGHFLAADLPGDVLAIEDHLRRRRIFVNLQRQICGGFDDLLLLLVGRLRIGSDALAQHMQRGHAVHRAGVEILRIRRLGEPAAHRGFAGAAGAVHGDDEAATRDVGRCGELVNRVCHNS